MKTESGKRGSRRIVKMFENKLESLTQNSGLFFQSDGGKGLILY